MKNKNELTSEDLRRLAREIVDKMTDQGRVELLEWAKKEFPELQNKEQEG